MLPAWAVFHDFDVAAIRLPAARENLSRAAARPAAAAMAGVAAEELAAAQELGVCKPGVLPSEAPPDAVGLEDRALSVFPAAGGTQARFPLHHSSAGQKEA